MTAGPERITLRPDTEAEAIARAGAVLREGGIALLPAEGVYGYHALASSERGLERLHALKPRAPGRGWIGLVARPADAYRWVAAVPGAAAGLIRTSWPGALTLILPAGPSVPAALVAEDGTVALRCPGTAFLRGVVLESGGLVLSTSANDPGAAPAAAVPEEAQTRPGIALVVDAGRLSGVPSTLARARGEVVEVLRAGAVPLAERAPDARA